MGDTNYEIVFNDKGEYDFNSIPEVICLMMCQEHDAGKSYAPDSRFTYTFGKYARNKSDFQFGTAKVCIQSYLIDNNKSKNRFDINGITPNGSKLKFKPVPRK